MALDIFGAELNLFQYIAQAKNSKQLSYILKSLDKKQILILKIIAKKFLNDEINISTVNYITLHLKQKFIRKLAISKVSSAIISKNSSIISLIVNLALKNATHARVGFGSKASMAVYNERTLPGGEKDSDSNHSQTSETSEVPSLGSAQFESDEETFSDYEESEESED